MGVPRSDPCSQSSLVRTARISSLCHDIPGTEATVDGTAEGGHRNHRWPPISFGVTTSARPAVQVASRDADAVSHRMGCPHELSKRAGDVAWPQSGSIAGGFVPITSPSLQFTTVHGWSLQPSAEVIAPAASASRVGSGFATAGWFRMLCAAMPTGRAARHRSWWAAPMAGQGTRRAR